MRLRSDVSFGYAITRRSEPVSVRSPAITAYCTPEESTTSFTAASSITLCSYSVCLDHSKRHSKLVLRAKFEMNSEVGAAWVNYFKCDVL